MVGEKNKTNLWKGVDLAKINISPLVIYFQKCSFSPSVTFFFKNALFLLQFSFFQKCSGQKYLQSSQEVLDSMGMYGLTLKWDTLCFMLCFKNNSVLFTHERFRWITQYYI